MKLKVIVPAFMLIISLFSCQKEYVPSGVDPNPTPDPIADSNYLDKIYDIDLSSGGTDTSAYFRYVYDAQKRVISLIDSSYDTFDYNTDTYTYSYNGNDTLPYKMKLVTKWNQPIQEDSTVTYFYYNSLGLRIKDSSVSTYYISEVSNYQYTTTKLYRKGSNTSSSGGGLTYTVAISDTATLDVTGNVISNIGWRGTNKTISTVTYDNHPSPFAKLSNYKTFRLLPSGETLFYEMPQQNNRLSISEETTSNGVFISSYDDDLSGQYSYKANGYPSQILTADEKAIFIYKKL